MSSPPSAVEREHVLSFHGSAGEYFRIWIVNLCFSVITLGIYSAWAKVRKKRYFYGDTRLAGTSFDYFADLKAILKGRLLAFAAFAVHALVTEIYPESWLIFIGILLLALAWLVVCSASFNARNSACRGLKFGFRGTTREAGKIFIGFALLMPLTLGLIYPYFIARQKGYIVSRHAYGAEWRDASIRTRR